MKDLHMVHIPKCGGTSLKKAFGIDTGHQTYLSWKNSIKQEQFERTFTFAFVRNPFTRIASLYRFNRKHRVYGLEEYVPFQEWFYRAVIYRETPYYYDKNHFMPAYFWVIDNDGSIGPDFVGRLEDIEQDFESLKKAVNFDVELPHLNATQPTGSQYDDTMVDAMLALYIDDFTTWYPEHLKIF